MPTRTEPSCSPGRRSHSCSAVYFRSSGYKPRLLGSGDVIRRLLTLLRFGEVGLGSGRRTDSMSSERSSSTSTSPPSSVDLVARAQPEGERLAQGIGLADHVDDVRRLDQRPVDQEPALGVLERGLRHDPHLAVDLHRLGAGGAQLLHRVEERVELDLAGRPR